MEAVSPADTPNVDNWPWKWDKSLTDYIPATKAFKDLTGQTFGTLTTQYPVKIGKNVKWVCECSCGKKQHKVKTGDLTSGKVASCGCGYPDKGKYHPNAKWVGNIPGAYLAQIHTGARVRGIPVEVSDEYIAGLFDEQEGKCALTGFPIKFGTYKVKGTASLDRINSKHGYIEDNIQWVHKDVNKIKLAFDESYLIYLCFSICKHVINKRQQLLKDVYGEEYFMHYLAGHLTI